MKKLIAVFLFLSIPASAQRAPDETPKGYACRVRYMPDVKRCIKSCARNYPNDKSNRSECSATCIETGMWQMAECAK